MAIAVLAGCTSKVDQARERLIELERNDGSPAQLCQAAKQFMAEATSAHDARGYSDAKLATLLHCAEQQER